MAETKEKYSKKKEYSGRHCWLKDHNVWEKAEVFVFLSRAPLTFGHSQLIVDVGGNVSDDKMFHTAVLCIRAAIKTFESTLQGVLDDEDSTWADLAQWPKTRGKYLKTLILRSSASEQHKCPGTHSLLKVHLVPYFQFHADECLERFRGRHRVRAEQRGGLLGWLGTREDEVDKLEVDFPCERGKNECAKTFFKLDKLAKKLRPVAKKQLSELNEAKGKQGAKPKAPKSTGKKATTGKSSQRRK